MDIYIYTYGGSGKCQVAKGGSSVGTPPTEISSPTVDGNQKSGEKTSWGW